MNKLVFLFFISLAVVPSLLNADTIFFKDGMRLDVEKTWEENNQIKYILYGSTISVAMEKVERIEKSSTAIVQAQKLHMKTLRKYPLLEEGHEKPLLMGCLTDNPSVVIVLPIVEWNSFSEKEKGLLCKYVASFINDARSNPFSYLDIPQSAPAAKMIRRNALKMTDKSWIIIAGKIRENNKTILFDEYVRRGQR